MFLFLYIYRIISKILYRKENIVIVIRIFSTNIEYSVLQVESNVGIIITFYVVLYLTGRAVTTQWRKHYKDRYCIVLF